MKRMILDYDHCVRELSATDETLWAGGDGAWLYVITKYNPPSSYANVSYRVTTRHDITKTGETEVYSGESLRDAIDAFNANTVFTP